MIYKTSGVLNFAQGAMVLFAALTFVSLVEHGFPFAARSWARWRRWRAWLRIERAVLRPLVNRSPMTLFMATLGLSWIIEGAAQLLGARRCTGSISASPTCRSRSPASSSRLRPRRGADRRRDGGGLTAFFRWTRIGLAFRAVADDQFAALAVGLRLPPIWGTVWTAAGFVALVAGLLWGARLGVQFSLSLIVLKALPVLVLGGFDSILGAIVGGLASAPARSWPRSIIGPFFGGGIEGWFAYAWRWSCCWSGRPASSARSSWRGY